MADLAGAAATLRGGGEVRCVALAAGGAWLAAGAGAALRLWVVAAPGRWRAAAARPGAHRYGVTAVAWGAALLASGGVDGAVRLWGGALRGGRRLGAPGAAAVRALLVVGGRVLAGHDDGALRAWSAAGALLAALRPHDAALTALCAPAATLLFTVADDGVLKVYDFNEVCSGSEVTPLEWQDGAHDLGALCAAAAPGGSLAATAGHDARIRIWTIHLSEGAWQVQSGGVLLGHNGAVSALSWAGELLASASHDRTARLWRLGAAPGGAEVEEQAAGECLLVLHAHARYLTAVAIDYRQRFLVTGSSDKTLRVWTLGDTTADEELQPPCELLSHFGLGDLEGIEPIADDELLELESMASGDDGQEEEDDEWCGGMCARRVWSQAGGGGPINALSARGGRLAAAASDGSVAVWEWRGRRLELKTKIAAHEYPALCVALPTPLLLSAGLDGVMKLWDIDSGCLVRAVSAGGSERVGEEAGAGVRGAAAARGAGGAWSVLLASDAGAAQLWSLAARSLRPDRVYCGFNAACTCVAWSGCGRLCAGGGAGGELRVWVPGRAVPELACNTDAHDLGVQAIGWSSALSTDSSRVLASVGADSFLKLWLVEGDEESQGGSLQLAAVVEAHGGAVAALCWLPAAAEGQESGEDGFNGWSLLATGGEDRWARVWRVTRRGDELHVRAGPAALPAMPPHAAHLRAPVLALAFLPPGEDGGWHLAVGTLAGAVSVWALSAAAAGAAAGLAEPPRLWGRAAVALWLREYVVTDHDSPFTLEEESELVDRAEQRAAGGAWLLDTPLHELMEAFGFSAESESARSAGSAGARRLEEELRWLRRPPYPHTLEALAPHGLQCPLGHGLLRDPVCAGDGYSYERAAHHHHELLMGAEVSPVTGRRVRGGVRHNRALRDALRAFLVRARPDLYAGLELRDAHPE